MSRAAENQLCTCAPVAVLSDKLEIFRLFAFDSKVSNYLTNIKYARSSQYANVVEFNFVTSLITDYVVCFMEYYVIKRQKEN